MTALMMGMVLIMTMLIRVPVPATKGYIHLGDCMIFFAVLLLGWKWGAAAAGIGSALADLAGGYAYYAPITLAVKSVMAIVVGLFIQAALKKNFGRCKTLLMEVIGMVLGGAFMVAGYYIAEVIMYGNWLIPLVAIPMNILQFAVGAVIATALATALYRTPVNKNFEYHLPAAVKKQSEHSVRSTWYFKCIQRFQRS